MVRTAEDAQALCLRCRMCCDGTLFAVVPLTPQERAVAKRARLPVVNSSLEQPCAALGDDGHCCIYASRPGPCQSYTCVAYRGLSAGEMDFEAAVAKIDRARNLARDIRARLTDRFVGFEEVCRLIRAEDDDTAAWRVKNGELLMDLVAFVRICESDFGTPRV
jgi:Fe-S-cluster containining protein